MPTTTLPHDAHVRTMEDNADLIVGRALADQPFPIMNVSSRKVGGLRFVKIGRLTLSFALARRYRAL